MKTSNRIRLDLARYYRLPSVQVSLTVVMAFVVTAFFVIFAIRPTFATITSLQKEIEESRRMVATLSTKVDSLQKAATLLEAIKPNLPKLEASVPGDGVGYDQLSYNLEALAQSAGVTLESFSLGESVVSSRLVEVYIPNKKQEVIPTPITIRIKGEYPQANAFLTQLASTIRLTEMRDVTILRDGTSGNRANSTESLTMTIVGSVYYLADASAVTKVIPEQKRRSCGTSNSHHGQANIPARCDRVTRDRGFVARYLDLSIACRAISR